MAKNYCKKNANMANAKLYLDRRSKKKDGTYPVKILVTHKGTNAFISTGVSVPEVKWDAAKGKVVNLAERELLNNMMFKRLAKVKETILSLHAVGRLSVRSARELREIILREIEVEEHIEVRGQFHECFMSFVDRHENPRTRDLYIATWRKIEKFDNKARRLTFADITKAWLEQFFSWCVNTSPSVNARNIHLRNIRAVFNDAIDNEITDKYPFRRMSIRPVATCKRDLSVEKLRELFGGNYEGWMQRYVDVFKLSFYLIGINIGDLLSLADKNYVGGRIRYNRKKTKRYYSIKVEPEAEDIIRKYAGERHLINVADNYKSYRNYANKLNMSLQKIVPGITTYWARHSWATIAASLDIPKETIAAALGHGGNTVTDIYIDFDMRKVDAANRKVIDYVLQVGEYAK